ncbi:14009_t:CDS:2 [Ambispora leptoticha]|uniref:14009_t:CDS:1 n=1 Tax=Ambispora leptoticha TaxID=144679 RepID=A0A9N8V8E8_9GLOM|nr:14009_t:CDS:2 [Ambispora leptoticha]
MNRMRTETEWRRQESVRSHKSKYSNETETLWIEFIILFNERRKREGHSPIKMYNVLSEEIELI